VIVGKAIIILLAFTLLIPHEAIYTTSLVQALYPVIPLAIVLRYTRANIRPRNRSLAVGIVGGFVLAVLFTYLNFIVVLFFYPQLLFS
jgi:hypothetical protein